MGAVVPRVLRTVVAVAAVAVTATACGASEPVASAGPVTTGSGAATTGSSAAPAAGAEGRTQYPLTLENCGVTVTVPAAPQRAVSLDQDSTEILLSLGLQDHMVGTASWTDPVLDSLAAANEKVPRLADNAPTYEVLMGADPDFVTASFGRHYKEGGVATRDRLASTAVPSYLSPTDCDNGQSVNGGTGVRTTALTVDALFTEIRDLAAVFDVPSRGEALIAELQRRQQAATEGMNLGGASVAFWFADTKAPYVAGGLGWAQMLATTTGMKNVFATSTDDWSSVGWESMVDAQPQILVLGDLQRNRFPGDRLDDKTAFLAQDPLTSTMTAVSQQNYIALHGAELNPSIRYVDALEKIRAWSDAHGTHG